jgi:transcriptional regulator NrdR family protein
MECPKCGSKYSNVINSRKIELNVFRTRLCKNCKERFYTEETVISNEEARYYMSYLSRKYRSSKKEEK